MKHSILILLLGLHVLLSVSATAATSRMRVILTQKNLIIADKGREQGVRQNARYAIMRNTNSGVIKIGTAYIALLKEKRCGLKINDIDERFLVQTGDILVPLRSAPQAAPIAKSSSSEPIVSTSFPHRASDIKLSFGGGALMPVGAGGEYWNLGYNVNLHVLYPISSNIWIGIRGSFSHSSPNENRILKDIEAAYGAPLPGLKLELEASMQGIEIAPMFRFTPSQAQRDNWGAFLQGGCGIYLLQYEANFSAAYLGAASSSNSSVNDEKMGISIGGGLRLNAKGNNAFEIVPLYHRVFTNEAVTEFVTLSLCFLF